MRVCYSDRYAVPLPTSHPFPMAKYRLVRDRLGKLKLTIEGLRRRDEFVIAACRQRGLPVVTTMGGGYAKEIGDTVEAHCNTVRVALAMA